MLNYSGSYVRVARRWGCAAVLGWLCVVGAHAAPVVAFAVAAYITGAYWFTAGLQLSGFAAWAAGIGTYHAISRLWPDLGATLPAFVGSAVVYIGLRLVRARFAGALETALRPAESIK